MPQKPDTVIKELKTNKFATIYVLQGDETYYIDKISDLIEDKALPPIERGFNQTVFYGKDVNMNGILSNARRFPMMAERQVVIVKEAQEIQDWKGNSAKEMLLSYCQKPLPSTILVMNFKNHRLDARTKLAKELEKLAVFVDSKKIYDDKLPDWIMSYVKEQHLSITSRAAILLSEYIGNDLNRIANEIDKLLINLPAKTEINEEIIAKYVGISKEYSTFELQNAIGQKDVSLANKIVHYFSLNTKDNPVIPIIALLFGFFAKLLLIHHATDKSKQNLASLLGVNPFFMDGYLQASRNYPLFKVIRIIEDLRTADLQSKGISSTIFDSEILKELVFKILHR